MRSDLTHISIILDRSGSMSSVQDDTIGGFNQFLAKQKAEPGQATLTLVQFDSQDPYEVIHHLRPLADVPDLTEETYVPRGGTPLLDAMGRGLTDLKGALTAMPADARPAKVLFVVITDGHENASREFSLDGVKTMIKERTEQDGWQFAFIGADLESLDGAREMGIHLDSTMQFEANPDGVNRMWCCLSDSAVRFRDPKSTKFKIKSLEGFCEGE